jgi:hypothetical protein
VDADSKTVSINISSETKEVYAAKVELRTDIVFYQTKDNIAEKKEIG